MFGAALAAGRSTGKPEEYRNTGMGAEARDTPEIMQSIDNLEKEIVCLNDVLMALFSRLGPVVRSFPPAQNRTEKESTGRIKCDLATALDGKALSVRIAREAAEVIFANLSL